MNVPELLQAYAQLPPHNGISLPPMRSGTLVARSAQAATKEQAWEALAAFRPAQGWIGYQSRVAAFTRSDPPPPDDETGCILCAECVDFGGQSLHIRQDGKGAWIIVRFFHLEGSEHLVDEVSLVATRAELGNLVYRRYWQIDARCAVSQIATCFCGFARE